MRDSASGEHLSYEVPRMRLIALLLSSLFFMPAALPAFQIHPKPRKANRHKAHKGSHKLLRAPKKPKK